MVMHRGLIELRVVASRTEEAKREMHIEPIGLHVIVLGTREEVQW